jgi:hypothetical protein
MLPTTVAGRAPSAEIRFNARPRATLGTAGVDLGAPGYYLSSEILRTAQRPESTMVPENRAISRAVTLRLGRGATLRPIPPAKFNDPLVAQHRVVVAIARGAAAEKR